jgi:hypothetical protein
VQISPADIEFGDVDMGATASFSVSLLNQGHTSVNVGSLTIAGQSFALSAGAQSQLTLTPGVPQTFSVTFSPTSAGDFSGQVTALDKAGTPLASAVIHGHCKGKKTPQLTLSTSALSFGSVTVNSSSMQTLTLTSTGSSPVTVSSVAATGVGFEVSGGSFPAMLNPGESLQLEVTFDPATAGTAMGSITIVSNSVNAGTAVVSLSGIGVAGPVAQLTVSTTGLAFGSVTVNTKLTKALTLTSSGTAAVTVGSVSEAGGGFSISGASFPATLNPGQSITVSVTFDPTATSSYSGIISIASDSSSGAMATVSLSGTGVPAPVAHLMLSATSLAFGNITVNAKQMKTLTLTSTGTTAVTVNSVSEAGAGFSMISIPFPAKLNPGQSVSVVVTFDPTMVSSYSGKITIASDSSPVGNFVVDLSGTGVAAPVPQLTISAASLAFGSVTLNNKQAKTLTLTSSGTAAVTVNSVSEAGAGFSLSGSSFPVTLNPGQSVGVVVTFDPTAASSYSGTITVTSDSASSGTATVNLSGTGVAAPVPQLTVSATSLTFGNVTVNSTATQGVTLTSTGTVAVTVSAVSEAGAGFSLSGPSFPATLNPGQSVTVQVTFDPTAATSYIGNLTITSNSTTGTAMVTLSGTGSAAANPVLTVSAGSLDFGSVPVGTPSTLSLTLTSTGNSPVTVSAESLAGAGFSVSGATFPVTLNPTVAIKLQVQFDPTAAGTATGQLTFASNSSTGGTTTVSLTGNGTAVQHQVTLSWSPPTNSPVPVSGYHIYRSTGATSTYVLETSLANSQTSYVDTSVLASVTYAYYVTSVDSAGTESSPSNQVTVTIP